MNVLPLTLRVAEPLPR
jgi:dihydrolipoamide dehydrogenase